MSGGEPLWRRVAGLYLSGIPADAGDRMSTRAPMADAAMPAGNGDPTQEIIMLGEALDLVTLSQGYRSPAVPILLRALIRVVRQVAAERAEAEAAAAAQAVPADEPEEPETELPNTDKEPVADGGDNAAADAEKSPVSEEPAEEVADEPTVADVEVQHTAELEKRVKETDQKVTALTTAVGQLVDVLQRRSRDTTGIDRRAAPRFPGVNAKLFLHGQPYEVINWSQGGFLIRISEADRFSRGGFDFHFVLDLPDETIEFQGRARPVRIERTTLAAEFASLDEAAAAKIGEISARLSASG